MTQLLKTLPPGRKPTGPVEINWNHPLSKGLVGCFVAGYNNSKPINLVSGVMMTDDPGPNATPVSANKGEFAYTFDGTNDAFKTGEDALHLTGSMSAVARVYLDDYGEVSPICTWSGDGETEGANSTFFMNIQTNGDIRLFHEYGAGVNQTADFTPAMGLQEWETIGFSRTTAATSIYEVFEAGKSLGFSSALTNATGGTDSSSWFSLATNGNRVVNLDGAIVFCHVYNRALSADEHLSISQDPYQFLQPAGTAARLAITTPPTPNATDGYRIPDPKWEEPAILAPGVKPTGPVVIDWDHPLAKGLIGCWLIRDFGIVDIVTGEGASISGSPSLESTTSGMMVYFSGDDSHIDLGNAERFKLSSAGTIYASASVIEGGSGGGGGYAGIVSKENAYGLFEYSQNLASYDWGGGGLLNTGFDIADDVVRGLAFTFSTSNGRKLYSNGDFKGSNGTFAVSNQNSNLKIGINGAGQDLKGLVGYVYLFNTEHSAADVLSLSRDPYQFLIPQ